MRERWGQSLRWAQGEARPSEGTDDEEGRPWGRPFLREGVAGVFLALLLAGHRLEFHLHGPVVKVAVVDSRAPSAQPVALYAL